MKKLGEEVARQIKLVRTARRMSQEELAKRVDVTRTSITNIESGRQSLSLALFCQISYALSIQPNDLLAQCIGEKVNVSAFEVRDPIVKKLINETIEKISQEG